MIEVITYNNKYLLIEGTDQPQLDSDGEPVPDSKYGTTETIEHPDPPSVEAQPVSLTKQQFLDLYAQNDADLTATLGNWPKA